MPRPAATCTPYELVDLLGDFTEHDLSDDGTLVPVDRVLALNRRDRRRPGDHRHREVSAGHHACGAAR